MPKAGRITIRRADGTVEEVGPGHFQKRSYGQYRRSRHWRCIRMKALDRDGYRCKGCRRKDRLEVHHMTYERLGRELLADLVTLCQRCHATQHQWAKRRGF